MMMVVCCGWDDHTVAPGSLDHFISKLDSLYSVC